METKLATLQDGTTASSKYVLGLLVPALFALLLTVVVRVHSLAPGNSLPQGTTNLLAVAAVALVALLASGKRLHVRPRVAIILLALAASTTISVLGSGYAALSQQRLLLYAAIALLALATYLAYRDEQLPLAAFFLAIALAHLPFLLAGVLWIQDAQPPFWQQGLRLAHFENVRQFAELAFFAATCSTGLGVLSRRWLLPSLVLTAAALFGIVLTGSRGALLSWLVFVLLMCTMGPSRLRAALLGVVALTVSAALVWQLDRSGVLPSPNLFQRVAEQVSGEASFDTYRLSQWGDALGQIWTRPWFGAGPEGYWISGCCDRNVLQVHNFILQFLIEFGVVGCGIVILLAGCAISNLGGVYTTIKLALATPGNRVLAGLLAAYSAYSLVDQTMYHLLPLLLAGLFAGLLAAGLAQARSARLPD